MLESGAGLFGMLRNCPETLALAIFSFAAIWFLGGLAIFHAYLIVTNQVGLNVSIEIYCFGDIICFKMR